MAASHWRKTPRHGAEAAAAPGGVEGLLPLDGFQPRPAVVSLKLVCGRTPTGGNLNHVSLLLSKSWMKPNKKFAKPKKTYKIA